MSALTLAPELEARLGRLREEGWALFDHFDLEVRQRGFHPFVAADYECVLEALIAQRAPGLKFLEWGSATGVITIMADLLGYDASGIELDESLVQTARDLAARFDSNVRASPPAVSCRRVTNGSHAPATAGSVPSDRGVRDTWSWGTRWTTSTSSSGTPGRARKR